MKLKDTAIRNMKLPEKTVKLFDGGGLYLQVSPKGAKWWRFKYRFDDKDKCISLGIYPAVSLKEARARREDMRALLSKGINPSEERKKAKKARIQKRASKFSVIVYEWTKKNKAYWSEKHYKKVLRRLEYYAFPTLGELPIADITAPQLLEVLRVIENLGNLYTAHDLLVNFGQVFRYAIATGHAERNISADLRGALPPVKSKHFPAITEPKQVSVLLKQIDAYQGSLVVSAALRLAPLVFVRPGELRKALWADIDFELAEWRYVASKTRPNHIVPLSKQALVILKDLYPITGKGQYVFPSMRTYTRPMSDNAVLAALRRMGIPKEVMSGHGFRAMARTILDEVLNVRPDLIEHQLAHAVRDPNGRAYNRTTFLPERKQMMQQWADYLGELKNDDYQSNIKCRPSIAF